ncbi:hypothetical protein AB0J90_24230 [Micromonospora sp. NPDC049523]|uniref:hypothetical protein n=1 Tax=Micromonospora sp. NPDC049523 TaxID=3155921 RepID=UPI0034363099
MRSIRLVLVGALVGVGAVAIGPAAPAAAALPLENCYNNERPQHGDGAFWSAPGNQHTPWAAPAGIQDGDIFRITASGSVRVDYWGTSKNIVGELPAPGLGSGWPAPDSPRYALVAKVTAGLIWSTRTGRLYHANEWFPVGADSRCVQFQGWDVGIPQLVFSYNDPNLGDNGGGAQVAVKQWW